MLKLRKFTPLMLEIRAESGLVSRRQSNTWYKEDRRSLMYYPEQGVIAVHTYW